MFYGSVYVAKYKGMLEETKVVKAVVRAETSPKALQTLSLHGV